MGWNVVVSASRGYEPGLTAFLNSFKFYHDVSKIKVHVLLLEMDDYPLPNWCVRVTTPWVNHPAGGRNTAWSTKIPRFKYAAELNDIVMLCDVDMFFCSNVEPFFRIAETGLIVGGSNGSHIRYHEDWRTKYKLPVPDFFNYKTICSVPTVMDTRLHGQVWLDLYNHKMSGGEGADFDLQNIFMTIHNKQPIILAMPSQQTTGIHHFMLKPDSRVVEMDGKLVTRDGLEVYIIHGKWWQENWRNNLITKMENYCKGNAACVAGAIQSRDLSYAWFTKFLTGGQNG